MLPKFNHIMTCHIELGMPVDAGIGHRMIPVVGGTVQRAQLNSRILAGGADWQMADTDAILLIGARWVMETDGGTRIQVETPGIRRAGTETLSELAAGRDADPAKYYFRVIPRFTVAGTEYAWLQQSLLAGLGAKRPQHVEIDIFALA